jgi:hypothetical protein
VLAIQTVHHILKKYSSSKCKQTVCLHTDLTSTLKMLKNIEIIDLELCLIDFPS